jgi:hypothetical protein
MIIQTILLYPSGAVWTDRASNVSRLDPSGAIQFDAEHPSRNRKVMGPGPPGFGVELYSDPNGRDRFAVTDEPGTLTSSAKVAPRGRARLLIGRLQPA